VARTPGNKILRDNAGVTKAAVAYGNANKIVTTRTVKVEGWEHEIPEVEGVFRALVMMQAEEMDKSKELLWNMATETNVRRRGELRRHYNSVQRNIVRNDEVLNALVGKKIGLPMTEEKKPKAAKPKAAKPKAAKAPKKEPAKKRPSPKEVKKAADKRRTTSNPNSRRAKFEKMSFAEVQQAAKKRGFKAHGSKESIINRILNG
tara:strand:- start:12226 stop:12837 length:612 start_codon:yes stop_codon:yes gene_type:complete